MADRPAPRFVSDTPIDAKADLRLLERADLDAPTRILVWRRFRRHRLGAICCLFLVLGYLSLPFAGFFAPYPPNSIHEDNIFAPPQGLYLFHEGEYTGLHTYPTATEYDRETGLMVSTVDYTDNTLTAFALAGGGGVALDRQPASGALAERHGLVPCLPGFLVRGVQGYALIYPARTALSRAARRFRDWILAEAAEEA